MATQRRYSDEDRAAALAALAANNGNVGRTAYELGLPATTLRQWATGARHPEAAQMSGQKKAELADALEDVAWQLVGVIPNKLARARLGEVATPLGIALDKLGMLRAARPFAPPPAPGAEEKPGHEYAISPEVLRAYHDQMVKAGLAPPLNGDEGDEEDVD
jgi:hypothetical protein